MYIVFLFVLNVITILTSDSERNCSDVHYSCLLFDAVDCFADKRVPAKG